MEEVEGVEEVREWRRGREVRRWREWRRFMDEVGMDLRVGRLEGVGVRSGGTSGREVCIIHVPLLSTINYIAHYISFSLSMTTPASCLSSQFTCNNGNCVSSYDKCDKDDDCGDNSDEFGCGKVGCGDGYGDGRSSLHHWMGDGFNFFSY